ncbi:hypothetical protein [Teredinibacter purpureus]|uniref:hypothetical protein n=1 Tax=Teredinibacter purpureus TaxID=2731756 RepID=UPI0005F858EA|nr:hypothetical protein [Teredinibacter purpureus]
MKSPQLPWFSPGTKYKTRGKHPRICTVKDVHTTYNLEGVIVSISYLSTHEFLGQTVMDRNVCESTIAMGLIEAVSP